MKKFAFKSMRTRLIFLFVILGLTPLLIGILITYIQNASSIKQRTFDKLVAIRDLKVQQLEGWLEERIGDLKTTSTDTELVALGNVIFKERKDQGDLKIYKNIRRILNLYLKNYDAYDEIFIINPRTGIVEISTDHNSEGMDKSGGSYFIQPIKTRELFIKDIYYSKSLKRNMMCFSVPLFCSKHDQQHVIGILVARVDLKNSLYALLQDRVGLGITGETLIVNKDVLVLNELRWHENAPLNLQINAIPAIKASQGLTGIVEAIDYHGEKVLAAYTYIPQTNWGFIAKQDLAELYAPIKSMMVNYIILIAGALIAIFGVALFTARTIAAPVMEMAATAEKIRKGDFSTRNRILGSDELATLAETFNTMTESIESNMELREINEEITQTLVDAKDLPAFRTNILKKLVRVTDSQMGAYFVLNRDTKIFEPFTSMGVTPGLLKPFDGSTLEGELGMVVETKKITHIKDIPEDSMFKFRTFTGTILPKEIITIPIIIDNVVSGIVSLASIKPYPRKILDIMELPWTTGFGIALSNMQANAETKRLAEELSGKNQELQAQAEELQSQTEELQQQSEELQQTADELQEQNTELELQRRQVEEANRLKSEFLSNMSHELRTPLNSVMALSRVLISQASHKLSEDESNYLKVIERSGKNLLALINDILDLAKIEAGRMDVSLKLFPLGSAVETIMERLEPLAKEKGLDLNQEIPADLPQIESDEIRVHQILQNLVGNAVKFTNEGSVTVTVISDAENIHIEVADTGIGIAEKDLPHIFEEFRQVDGSSARAYEGTGLGLTIAYRAARMLGGELRVESVLGKGSKFTLTLPIKWPEIMPAPGPVVPMPPVEIVQARNAVLVVDDDPGVAAMIADYLIREGYGALTATSGKQALELAAKHRPFAITLDILMPDMDGWEVLQRLKESPATKDIPVIIISIADDKEIGFALGAVGYITKPVNKDVLLAEINRIGGPATHTVLIVDDNALERSEMTQIIEQEGMRAVVAENGKICMDMIKESVPDVLVLDLIMPEMDGFEVLKRVRSDPATRNLPVIVVTAKELTDKDRKKLAGKVSSILAKSDTTSTALLEEIKKILGDIGKDPGTGEHKAAKRILLVEDNEAAMIQVRSILESEGYGVGVARGGQEAIEYVKDTIPDGVILDLMMPDVDGFAVLENIRTHKATAKIPVLILTAKDLTPEDLKKIKSNNIQQLIQKGDVDRENLLFKVKSMLGEKVKLETGNLKIETPKPATITEQSQLERSENPAESGATSTEYPATILVVEDNPDNMISIKAVLHNQYTILEATDGEEGLNMALTEKPDLILLDMSLPKMDGFAVAGKIKEEDKTRHIPVIAMTAKAMRGDREMILAAGCDDYISKPIEPDNVLKKIEEWLQKPR